MREARIDPRDASAEPKLPVHRSDTPAEELGLRCGDWVEVRSREEILCTLDDDAMLDSLPFMPEMLRLCGRRFRVYKRADKTCDTIHRTGARRMRRAVHLEGVRCDGQGHGGCQAACLIFWKEAWLKRVAGPADEEAAAGDPDAAAAPPDLDVVHRSARRPADGAHETVYRCQATELYRATTPLAWWDLRQYVRDVHSGNFPPAALLRAAGFWLFSRLLHLGVGYRLLVRTHDRLQELRGGARWPAIQGVRKKTPTMRLDLQPGEPVQVKSLDEIVATLDTQNKNRGLLFDVEMSRYCGGTFRVLARVEQIIDERTGRMLRLPNDCVILDNVICSGEVSPGRLLCPRAIYSFWREIWLRRVE